MFTHTFIEPSQVNAFVYCKRNWYYRYRLKLAIVNEYLEIGLFLHEKHWLNTSKRKSVYLISEKFKLKGVCDYILKEGEHQIPLEIKKGICHMNQPYQNDVMQLMCYIILLEEHFSIKYDYGYILYLGSQKKYTVEITSKLRSELSLYLKAIKSYTRSKRLPKKQTNKNLCGGCSFEDYCWCDQSTGEITNAKV